MSTLNKLEDIKNNRPIIIIDGFNCFIRHYLVNQELNSKSQPIGGVVGFLRQLNNIINLFSPKNIYVIWENGGPSPRRKKILPDYKSGRTNAHKKNVFSNKGIKAILALDEEARIQQLTILANILKTTPICQIYVSETECDDIIAYLVKNKFKSQTNEKIIVSTDKDFYQLLDNSQVLIFDPAIKSIIDAQKVKEKYGISAQNFCMAKILVGDASDNISGIPGVGFKTILKRFGSFQRPDVQILDVISEAKKHLLNDKKPLKVYKEVAAAEELIRRNWQLMYLDVKNLSASQIKKIDYIVDNHESKMDKMAFIKAILDAGINSSFDFENFIFHMKIFLK